jgi:uncharacterized protein (TIGR03435 family)
MAGADRVRLKNWALLDLIAAAYSVRATQVSGLPWMANQAFDVEATVPVGTPKEKLNGMLQSLLEDRFGLMAHRTTKTGPGFALVVGKDGAKMQPAAPPHTFAEGMTDEEKKTATQKKMQETFAEMKKHTEEMRDSGVPLDGYSTAGWPSMTTEELAAQLVGRVGGPVVDETGLTGKYSVKIETWKGSNVPGGTIFDAVEKLGLRLEPRKVTVETVVVDEVSKMPTPN